MSNPFAQRLLRGFQQAGQQLVGRAELVRLYPTSDVDQAMRTLVATGHAEELKPGFWLIPSGRIPVMDCPRWWSNRSLEDPEIIIDLTLSDPSISDMTRLVLSYGPNRVHRRLEALAVDAEIHPEIYQMSKRQLVNAWDGIRAAARIIAELPCD